MPEEPDEPVAPWARAEQIAEHEGQREQHRRILERRRNSDRSRKRRLVAAHRRDLYDRGCALERGDPLTRALRATAIAAPLFVLATCAEWGGLLSSAYPGDLNRYEDIANWTFQGQIPYHSFYDEYPPGALPAFLLPRAISQAHYNLVFKLVMILCWIVALWAAARILAELGASRQRMAFTLGAMIVTPPLLGHVFLNRYDPYAAMLAVLGLLAFVLRRERLGAGWLSAGFEAKVFPAAAIPIAAIRIWRLRGQRRLVESVGVFVAVGLAFAGYFLVVAFGGIGFSYYSQVKRGLQIESMGASILLVADKLGLYTSHWVPAPPGQIDLAGTLPRAVGNFSFAVEVVAILAVAWAYWRGRESNERLVAAFAASVVGYMIFSKVLSPQYVTWLVPLVALVRGRLALILLLAALPLTQAEVNWGDHGLRAVNWSVWLLAARNVLLVAVFVVLLRGLRRTAE